MATKHTTGTWTLARTMSRIEVRVSPVKAYAFSHSDEANARLIAAAPDLLEALESLYHTANSIGEDTCDPVAFAGALEDARAAIEKAKGE